MQVSQLGYDHFHTSGPSLAHGHHQDLDEILVGGGAEVTPPPAPSSAFDGAGTPSSPEQYSASGSHHHHLDNNNNNNNHQSSQAHLGQLPGLSLPPTRRRRGRPPASESHRSESPVDGDILLKGQRNNVAAKKYRQKKIDRIQELEEEVDDVKRERDELRIRLARQEAETAALREMLKMATSGMMIGNGS